jgi:DNA-binding NtrC family response regulator
MQPDILVSKKPAGTVLIVDDDEGVRRVMTRWVADLGHEVLVAVDAESALELMRGADVDVALCDVRMPGKDGIWLVEQLRRAYPATSIVMATGLTELDPTVTLRPGVVGYLVKPFHRAALEEVIQKGLEARRERHGGPSRPQPLLTGGRPSMPVSEAPDGVRMGWTEPIVEGIILGRYPA